MQLSKKTEIFPKHLSCWSEEHLNILFTAHFTEQKKSLMF